MTTPADWTLPALLGWWCGPPRPSRRPAVDLPPLLLDFYQALAGYDDDLTASHILIPPTDVVEVDGLLVFWLETDETYEWATDGIEVYEREIPEDGEPADDWNPTEMQLAEFLVSLAAFELVMGAPNLVSIEECEEPERLRVLAGLNALPMSGPFLETALLAGDDALAFTGEGFAYVAVRSPEQLITFERRRD